jgi:hypothetical protein
VAYLVDTEVTGLFICLAARKGSYMKEATIYIGKLQEAKIVTYVVT